MKWVKTEKSQVKSREDREVNKGDDWKVKPRTQVKMKKPQTRCKTEKSQPKSVTYMKT